MSNSGTGWGTPVVFDSANYYVSVDDVVASMLPTVVTTDQAQNAIQVVQAEIDNYVGVSLLPHNKIEWVNSQSLNSIQTSDYPLLKVYSIWAGTKEFATIQFTTASTLYAQASIQNGKLDLISQVSGSAQVTTELTLSSYTTMAALKAAVEAITGWALTVNYEGNPSYLRDTGTGNCADSTYSIYGPNSILAPYSIKPASGLIILYPYTDTVNYGCMLDYLLDYRAGYTNPPGDLEQIALEMCGIVLGSSKVDYALKSEKLDDYQYEINSEIKTAFQPFYSRLDYYKKPRL